MDSYEIIIPHTENDETTSCEAFSDVSFQYSVRVDLL
jgi:hypothetical protein